MSPVGTFEGHARLFGKCPLFREDRKWSKSRIGSRLTPTETLLLICRLAKAPSGHPANGQRGPRRIYRTTVNQRLKRAADGHRQSCHAAALFPMARNMICARPIRFSNGT